MKKMMMNLMAIDMSKDKPKNGLNSDDMVDTEETGTFTHGIKVHHKKGIKITGATIRIKAVPSRYGTSVDYVLSIDLPNKKSITLDQSVSTQCFSDVGEQLFLAAVGHKPKTSYEKVVENVEGFPIKMSEYDLDDDDDTIPIANAPDPTKVMTQPEMPVKAKEEPKKKDEAKTEFPNRQDSDDKKDMDSQPKNLGSLPALPAPTERKEPAKGIGEMMGYA